MTWPTTYAALTDRLAYLNSLTPGAPPLWGQLSPQLMIEHLAGSVLISNGRLHATLHIPAAEVPARQAFLTSDAPFSRHLPNPLVPTQPRFPDLATARAKFWSAWDQYGSFWSAHPTATPLHPLFGPLTGSQWLRFHAKHFTHHLQQFGWSPEAA